MLFKLAKICKNVLGCDGMLIKRVLIKVIERIKITKI